MALFPLSAEVVCKRRGCDFMLHAHGAGMCAAGESKDDHSEANG
jgi:hypothetical protein